MEEEEEEIGGKKSQTKRVSPRYTEWPGRKRGREREGGREEGKKGGKEGGREGWRMCGKGGRSGGVYEGVEKYMFIDML